MAWPQKQQTDSRHLLLPNAPAGPVPQQRLQNPLIPVLEAKSARLVDHINNHDFTHSDWRDWFASDFEACGIADDWPAMGLERYLAVYKAFTDRHPGYIIGIQSISTLLEERVGFAVVWLHLRVTGQPDDICRESVTTVHWKQTPSGWIIFRKHAVRGIGW